MLLQNFGINPSRPYALSSKADRQRLHAERLQIVSQARPLATASNSHYSYASEATYARAYLAESFDRREQARVQAQADGLAFTRNPRKVREAHEAEQRRLAELEREIKSESRLLSWTVRRD